MKSIQFFLLAASLVLVNTPADAQIRMGNSGSRIDGSNIQIVPPGSGGSFIGKDPETGDSVMRVTPPPRLPQQQPSIPYIVPQVDVPWQPQPPRPPIVIPPGYVPPGGIYPPGSFPPGGYPPGNYPPGNYPPSGFPPPPPGIYPPPGNYPPPQGGYPPGGIYPPGSNPPHYPVPYGR